MLERLIAVAAVLVVATVSWLLWRRQDGRVRRVDASRVLTAETLGAPRGAHATFVQFSTPLCSRCPGTAALLRRLAAESPGVSHVEIDASERLDLARDWEVMRTPTILVLNDLGVVVSRISGAPTEEQAREALASVGGPASEYSI